MIGAARRRIIGMLAIVVLLTYSDSVFSESPTTWNQTAELQKAIHDTNRPDRKNLAEEDTPSLRIPPATQESRSNGAEPGWLFIDYAKIDKYEEQISNMRKDQQQDIRKILGLMRIGKIPSQSVSWVQGTKTPPEFTLRDWDIANAEFDNGMILIENGLRRLNGQIFVEGDANIYFIRFHFGGLHMNNTSCVTDMTKAVISEPMTNASANKNSEKTKFTHKQKWPFHYGSFFVFDDVFDKSDILYYGGSQTIIVDKKRASKKREEQMSDSRLRAMMKGFSSFPGTIEFKGEICRNLAFASDFRE